MAKLFTPHSFESDFALVANVDGVAGGPGGQRHITMPDGTRRDHFLHWIESLADRQTPSWLGLPNNAEKVLLTTRGTQILYIDDEHYGGVVMVLCILLILFEFGIKCCHKFGLFIVCNFFTAINLLASPCLSYIMYT